jgi:hypothetical protein
MLFPEHCMSAHIMKFVAHNIAIKVEPDPTSVMLLATLCAMISEVETHSNFTISGDVGQCYIAPFIFTHA